MRISRVSGRMDPRVRPDRFHSTVGQARPETRGWTGRSILRPTICGCIALALLLAVVAPVGAQVPQTVSGERLKHREQIEQQATDVARQLVGEVLDVQLQQFRDNNLTSHPWYAEIRSMRDHLDALVSRQMKEVVEILAKSDLGDNAQRVKAYAAAEQEPRDPGADRGRRADTLAAVEDRRAGPPDPATDRASDEGPQGHGGDSR